MSETTIPLAPGEYLGRIIRRETVGGVVLAETAYSPNARLAPHRHEGLSFFLTTRAQFHVRSGSVDATLAAGSATVDPPGHVHGGAFIGRAPSGFNVELTPAWAAQWHVDIEALGSATTFDTAASAVPTLLSRLRYEHRSDDPVRHLAIQGLSLELVVALARGCRKDRGHNARLEAEADRVEEMLRSASTVPDWASLSRAAGASPAALARAFRSRFGCTPAMYVRRIRVAAAATALAKTSYALSRVALDAGFYDQAHFARTFRRAFGVTPSLYRRTMRGV